MNFFSIISVPVLLALLAGCTKREEIFEGQRFDVRTPLTETLPDSDGQYVLRETVNREAAIRLRKATNVSNWSHRNGNAAHKVSHLAFSASPSPLWSVSIGQGNDRKHRITSDPIVIGDRIFTLDSQSAVQAHATTGVALWSRDLTPLSDKTEDASGGGLSYGDGLLFATTGFGELTALDPETGATVWQQKLDAPLSAPPTIGNGLVFLVSRDNKAWALDTKNGRIKWQQQSSDSGAVLIGGGAPAVSGKFVFLPFGSGEMMAVLTRNGLRVWSAAVSGSRRGQARSNIGDISGDPVVSQGRIYAANQAGRLIAVERRTGERLWTATEGSYSPVWPVGGAVFVVSDAAQLVRLDGRSGEVVWAVDLPKFVKAKTRENSITHFGPILAGGRLIVASSDGLVRSFDPVNGVEISSFALPKGAASQPAIVNGVMYVLSQNGQLHAFK